MFFNFRELLSITLLYVTVFFLGNKYSIWLLNPYLRWSPELSFLRNSISFHKSFPRIHCPCVFVMWLGDLGMYHLICLIQSKGFNCIGVTVILSQTF